MIWALIKTFGPLFFVSAVYQFLYSTLVFAGPQIVDLLIAFVESDEPAWKGNLMNLIFFLWSYAQFLSHRIFVHRPDIRLQYFVHPVQLALLLRRVPSGPAYQKCPHFSHLQVWNYWNWFCGQIKMTVLFWYPGKVWSCPTPGKGSWQVRPCGTALNQNIFATSFSDATISEFKFSISVFNTILTNLT